MWWARREDQHDQRGADDIGGEHEQSELAAGIELRGADRPPIGGVRGVVKAKQRTRIDARPGELGCRLAGHIRGFTGG